MFTLLSVNVTVILHWNSMVCFVTFYVRRRAHIMPFVMLPSVVTFITTKLVTLFTKTPDDVGS